MPRLWRVCPERYQHSAFDGEGARRFGGRFNSPGVRVAYASESPALAMFEVLVHLESYEQLSGRVLVAADADDALVDEMPAAGLPSNWRTAPIPRSVQRVGDEWAQSGRTPVLSVPSVVVPHSWNYLVNPDHEAFDRLDIHEPEPLQVDPRLLK